MGPRFRFILVVLILATAAWAYVLVSEYMIGSRGLNLPRYLHGATIVGLAVLGGYLFVWASVRFMNFRENRKTGFEAIEVDDTGTKFNIHLSLSKFLPEIIAPTSGGQISPLESELLGFLNSLGDWPYTLDQTTPTLREYALNLWTIMGELPNTGPLHRAAALAADLGKVYAYQEKRKSAPLWHFWVRDQVSYSRRCHDHGGMAAFILSQMPAFRELGNGDSQRNQVERRALLTAIRYHRDPLNLPHNCDPLAREICEYLNRAQIQLNTLNSGNSDYANPTEQDVTDLQSSIISMLPTLLQDLDFHPEHLAHKRHGFFQGPDLLAVSTPHLIGLLVQNLPPSLRTKFQLWDTQMAGPALAPQIIHALREAGWLVEMWEEEPADKGFFSFMVGGTPLPKCFLIQLNEPVLAALRKRLSLQPALAEPVDLHYDLDHRRQSIAHKAHALDEELAQVFPR